MGLVAVAQAVTPDRRATFEAALDAAIAAVDAAAAPGLRMTRDDAAPDVAVRIVATPPYRTIRGTGDPTLDGAVLELGRVALRSRGGTIAGAAVAVSMHLPGDLIAPVVLEEVAQATGLVTDVRGPGTGASIFAEDANAATTLAAQDAMALRRHYAHSLGAPIPDVPTPDVLTPDGDD